MIRSMFIGISGLKAGQMALSGVANNISNSQTTGYKSQKPQFEELFYQQMKAPSAPGEKFAGTNPMDVGNGVRISSFATNFTQGNVDNTGNKTDLAIQGEGFFVLSDASGNERQYTRAGNFDVSKDNEIVTKNGYYVMGWNMDKMTGKINTGASLSPVKVELGSISDPIESSEATIKGNLNAEAKVGNVYGFQMPTWDRLGTRHDIDYNFIKMSNNTYRYTAIPTDQFKSSASIETAVLEPSQGIANQLVKGDFTIDTAASAVPGQVDITVRDPGGAVVLTKTISDVDGTVTLDDGTNTWFTIKYKGGGAPSSASFTIGEAGDMTFDALGKLQTVTGSGMGGNPMISYTPGTTNQQVDVQINIDSFTNLAADSGVKMTETNGMTASKLTNFIITDGGGIEGYYSDGSIKKIGQIALATFSNPSGLSRVGNGNFIPTPNSGFADIGVPQSNARGQIKAQALEASNVDIATELVNMMTNQRFFTANTKVISSSDQILQDVINLHR